MSQQRTNAYRSALLLVPVELPLRGRGPQWWSG
jgi:hypothetical protein